MTTEAREKKKTYVQHFVQKLEHDDVYPLFALNGVKNALGDMSFDLILPEDMTEETVIRLCQMLLDRMKVKGAHLKMFQVN